MGTSLTGTRISETYDGLIKTTDNQPLTGSLKQITDGLGNDSGVYLDQNGNLKAEGTVEFGSLKDTGENITISKLVDEADGIAANDNDTSIPTSAAVKDYVDNNVTAQDLDFVGDTGTGAVDLDSQSLDIAGGTGITTTASGQTLTVDIDSTVATLSGSQTLTNKSIDADNNTISNLEVDNLKAGVLDTDLTTVSATDNTLASAKAIKSYVDTKITAEDLDISGNTGTGSVDLDSQVLDIVGTGIASTTASGQTLTISVDATNLSNTPAASTVLVSSSTGTDTTLPAATTSLAGVLTGADKTKLDGIEAGAQVNVGTDLSNTPAASAVEVASSTGTNTTLPAATTSLAGVMTAADKTKLDGIATGAEVNVQSDWNAVSGDAYINNKPTLGALAALDSVGASTIDDNSVGAAELNVTGNGTSGQALTSDGDGSFSWTTLATGVDGTGTTNYVPKWSDADTIANSQIFDNGTNVGINDNTPSYKLDVNGTFRVVSTSYLNGATFHTGTVYLAANNYLSGTEKLWFQGDYDDVYITSDGTNYGNLQFITSSGTSLYLDGDTGYFGISQTSPSYVLDVTGQARLTGGYTTSDERLKENVKDNNLGLDELLLLRTVSYDWITGREVLGRTMADTPENKNCKGLIAQEAEAVSKDLVKTDSSEHAIKSLDNNAITAMLIKSIQQLNEKVDLLQNELNTLKNA